MTTTSVGDPLVGRVLEGRYEILAKVARGGMATVYRAQDRRLTRTVAVKVMHDGLGDDAEFARKFDREARAAATLNNPHVVSVFDQGVDNGRPYIVMEFVQGCTLRHVVTREAPLPPLRALEALESVASALASAHEAGLVHRDVKPENVLLSDRGQIKVGDFGLARAVTNQTATATQGLLIGTVSYLPPELVTTGRADARSDVYSAGVVLFEMLTGSKPHTGETPIQVAYSHVHKDIPAPSTLLAGNDPRSMDSRRIIPPYLDALVVACTRREPAERPRDGRELLRLVRIARQALSHGILDDPALTAQMRASMDTAATVQMPAVVVDAQARPDEGTALANLQQAVGASPEALARPLAQPARDRGPQPSPRPAGTTRPASSARPASTARRRPGDPGHRLRPAPTAAQRHRQLVLRRRRALAALLAVLVLALVLGGGSWWWFSQGRYEATPALAGQRQAQAVAAARSAGLGLQVVQEYSETVPRGAVIRTEPEAGSRVLKEGTVTAWVSRGPERHAMPSLVGMDLDQARRAIEGATLAVGSVREDWSDTVPAGVVATVSQPKGTPLKRGTAIDLVVSKGPEPIEIKDHTGSKADRARRELEAAGFRVQVGERFSDDVDRGKVVSQTPNGGNGKRGDEVVLVVSKGPQMVAVPRVAGMTEDQARAALSRAGLSAQVVHATPEWLREDKVKAASPGEGKTARKGSSVTLWVI